MVFVVTNDLSRERLRRGDSFDDDSGPSSSPELLPQSNKALRDEVLFFVTEGIRQATQKSAEAASHGSARAHDAAARAGSMSSAGASIASAPQNKIKIDANIIRGSGSLALAERGIEVQHSGGITLNGFLDQLMVLLVGSKEEREEVRHRLSFSGGEAGAFFESENEQVLAAELETNRSGSSLGRPGGAEPSQSRSVHGVPGELVEPASPHQSLPPETPPQTPPQARTPLLPPTSANAAQSGLPFPGGRAVPSEIGGAVRTSDSSVLRPRLARQSTPTKSARSRSFSEGGSPPARSTAPLHWSQPGLRLVTQASGGEDRDSADSQLRVDQGRANSTQQASDEVTFLDYCPEVFADVRSHFGIKHDVYIAEWTTAAKVKLNEGGASSAFFFYSGGERFIAKSCTRAEMNVLCRIAEDYRTYLKENPKSFLLRILGAHCFKTYNTDFFFFVMENIFKIEEDASATPPELELSGGGLLDANPGGGASAPRSLRSSAALLQERYDIKGSWVNRNCTWPKNGQKTTCRYCNQVYRFKRRDAGGSALSPRRRTMTFNRNTLTTADEPRRRGAGGSDNWSDGRSEGPSDARSDGVRSDGRIEGSFVGAVVNTLHNFASSSRAIDEDSTQLCPERLDRKHVPNIVLKDNDLNYRLCLSERGAFDTCEQLNKDSEFLSRLGLMDYSLLIGVHIEKHSVGDRSGGDGNQVQQDISTAVMGALQSRVCSRRAVFIEGPSVYYLGVVDILQEWNWEKQLERYFKILFKSAEPEGLSAVPPEDYNTRFQNKMKDILGVSIDTSETRQPMSPMCV